MLIMLTSRIVDLSIESGVKLGHVRVVASQFYSFSHWLSLIISWNSSGIVTNHLLFQLLKVNFNSIKAKSNFIEETLHIKNELSKTANDGSISQPIHNSCLQGTLPLTCLSCLYSQNTGNSSRRDLRTWRWWRGSPWLSGNISYSLLTTGAAVLQWI